MLFFTIVNWTPTEEFIKKENNRTTIAGPHKQNSNIVCFNTTYEVWSWEQKRSISCMNFKYYVDLHTSTIHTVSFTVLKNTIKVYRIKRMSTEWLQHRAVCSFLETNDQNKKEKIKGLRGNSKDWGAPQGNLCTKSMGKEEKNKRMLHRDTFMCVVE